MTNLLRPVFVIVLLLATAVSTSHLCFAQETEEASFSKIRKELAEAVDRYNQTIETAEAGLQSALDDEIGKIRSSLSTEERVHQSALLEGQIKSFKEQQTCPTNRGLLKASEKYHDSIQEAAELCFKAHTDAAQAFDKHGRLDKAATIQEARNDLLVTSPHWLPPIPLYVDVNIEALLAHRPKFGPIFDKEFKSIIRASKGKDRLRFRREINAAIEAVVASRKAGEPAGYPNCRADTVLVLETIKAGRWDLSKIKIYYRNHTKRRMHDGLPGVKYS